MAQQVINIGASPNDGTGDNLRAGGDKINDNFTEVYESLEDTLSVVTTAGSITLNFGNKRGRGFFGATSFATPKTIAHSNDTNAVRYAFHFQITDPAAKLTFPAGYIMSDVRWEAANPQEWEPAEIGKYKATATYDGTNWWLEISPAPYV